MQLIRFATDKGAAGRRLESWVGNFVILAIIAVGSGLRIQLALGSDMRALVDDAFYDFQIARTIGAGLVPSIDGVHPTNGYHPLWVLLLVGVFRVLRDSPLAPVIVARVLGATFDTATLVVSDRILRRLRIDVLARTAVVGLLALNPRSIEQATNGLETSLALFLLATTSLFHLQPDLRARRRNFDIVSGVLCGLTVLARTELIVPCLGWMFSAAVKDGGWRRGLSAFSWRGLVAFASVVAPWVVYSIWTTGEVIQSSAVAMMIAHHRIPLTGGLTEVPLGMMVQRSLYSLRDGFVLTAWMSGVQRLWGAALIICSLLLTLVGPRSIRRRIRIRLRMLSPLVVGLLVLFAAFTLVRLYYERWHSVPFTWFATIITGIVGDAVFRKRQLRLLMIGGAAILLLRSKNDLAPSTPEWTMRAAYSGINALTDCGNDAYADWSLEIDARRGPVRVGHVVNIDGVVNNGALGALREGRLLEYVEFLHADSVYMGGFYHSSVFLGPRYRERLVVIDDRRPEWFRLATQEEKDARIRLDNELLPNSPRGREVLSDGWSWDKRATAQAARSLGTWSELIVVAPGAGERRVQIGLNALEVGKDGKTQSVAVHVDGRATGVLSVPRAPEWFDLVLPADGGRHRIRLTYASPKLNVQAGREYGWWQTRGFEMNAVSFWGMRLSQ